MPHAAMSANHVAVIRGENNQCVIELAGLLECVENLANPFFSRHEQTQAIANCLVIGRRFS